MQSLTLGVDSIASPRLGRFMGLPFGEEEEVGGTLRRLHPIIKCQLWFLTLQIPISRAAKLRPNIPRLNPCSTYYSLSIAWFMRWRVTNCGCKPKKVSINRTNNTMKSNWGNLNVFIYQIHLPTESRIDHLFI